MKKINYNLLTFVFLLQTLFVPISVAGGVLCFSETHVAIEFNKSPATCHDESLSLEKILKLNHQFHQDICQDIPLLQHEKNLLIKSKKQLKNVFLQKIAASISEAQNFSFVKPWPLTSRLLPPMAHLQSVVLLI